MREPRGARVTPKRRASTALARPLQPITARGVQVYAAIPSLRGHGEQAVEMVLEHPLAGPDGFR